METLSNFAKIQFIRAASQTSLQNPPLKLLMNAKRVANYIKPLSSFIKNK
jgi:hypothetical protein